jgi:hypothetical protein
MPIDIQNLMDVPIYLKDMEGSGPTVKIEVNATSTLDTPRVLSIAESPERLNVYTTPGSKETRSG